MNIDGNQLGMVFVVALAAGVGIVVLTLGVALGVSAPWQSSNMGHRWS